jgi:hypothetical protein
MHAPRFSKRVFLLATAAVLLLALAPFDVVEAKKRKKKKAKPKPQEVEITQWDYCHSCITVVENFNTAVEDFAASRQFRESKDAQIDGNKIADNLCNGTYYEHYSDKMKYGCMKLLQDHYEEVIGGFRGTRNRGQRNVILEHKRKACVETKACIGHMADKLVRNQLKEKTKCNACWAVATDIDNLLVREKDPVPRRARLSDLLLDVCGDISIRHDDPAYLETLCDDLIDDMIGESLSEENSILVRAIKLRKSLETSGLKLTQTLQKKVCSELQGYCTDEEDPESEEGGDDEDGSQENEEEEETPDEDDADDGEDKTEM